MFKLKPLVYAGLIALFCLPAEAAQPLKGGIRTDVQADYVKEVQTAFAQFKDLMLTNNINVMNLYDPKARMTYECLAPEGPQSITLTGPAMRQYQEIQWKLNPSMAYVPLASFQSIPSVNPKTKHVPMIKVDYSLTATKTAPTEFQFYTMVLARQPVKTKQGKVLKYEWRIISQSTRLADPQGAHAKILTALTDPSKRQQIDQLIQSTASVTSVPAPTEASNNSPNSSQEEDRTRNEKPWKKKSLSDASESAPKPNDSQNAAKASETATAKSAPVTEPEEAKKP